MLPIKTYWPGKFSSIFEKGENNPKTSSDLNHTIKFSVSENPIVEFPRSYIQNCGYLHLIQRKDHGSVFCCFFPGGKVSRATAENFPVGPDAQNSNGGWVTGNIFKDFFRRKKFVFNYF